MSKAAVEIEKIYPLTPMQEAMLFHSIMDKDSSVYFEQMILNVKGKVCVETFDKSFNELIKRYDILRTVFKYKKVKENIQIVLKQRTGKIYFQDVSGLNPNEQENFIENYIKKDKEKGFDLSKEIPMRISVLQIEDRAYKIVWSHHHILMDGWCLGTIIRDFMVIYNALMDKSVPKFDASYPYSDYIKWLKKQDKQQACEYWKNYLWGYQNNLVIPGINGSILNKGYIKKEHNLTIEKEYTDALVDISRSCKITLNSLFQGMWGILLQKYNLTDDVVFGSVVSGRPPEVIGIDEMVGLFINTVPVRIKSEKNMSFVDMIKEIHSNSSSSKSFEYFSLADIQANSDAKQNLINHIVAFENFPLQREIKANTNNEMGFEITDIEVFEQTNYDFNVIVRPGEKLEITFNYNECVYDEESMLRIEGHLREIIKAVAAKPDILVGDMEIITEKEKIEILSVFNNTKTEYPNDKSIVDIFEDEALKNSGSVALLEGSREVTYGELHQKSSGMAVNLQQKGVKNGDIVAILAERSIETIIGLLAILKAGGIYLPIDPDYPKDRIDYMLKDSNANVILLQKMFLNVTDYECEKIVIDDDNAYKKGSMDKTNMPRFDDAAYIIYTSGSTGKPKGVIVEHRNVVRLVKNTNYVAFEKGDRILQTGAMVFDASTFEIWGALLNGLRLYLVDEDTILNSKRLAESLRTYEITTLWLTSPLFNQMAQQDHRMFMGVKNLLVGGDVLSPYHINKVRKECKNTRIINGYGPTENTTFSVCFIVDRDYEDNIPIGKPISNSTAYIVDSQLRLVPVGVSGELCVGGDGVGRGYLNAPELTQSRFVENPFLKGQRIYRTGDLARWTNKGIIEFLGRIDQQVKIRGFRIELGEIESRLLKISEVEEAVVVAKDDKSGCKCLCAYVVCQNEISIEEVKAFLSRELPEYMIPSYFARLDKLPLTINGKVDKKSLPEPYVSIEKDSFEAPVGETEEKLAGIWEEILGIKKVGRNQNFFDLGGHSLKVANLVSMIQKVFNTDVSLKEVFKRATVRELAEYLLNADESSTQNDIVAVGERDHYPLSSAQKRLFSLCYETKDTHYNVPGVMEIKGKFDVAKMQECFKTLIKRHDAFRTYFDVVDGVPIQRICKEVNFCMEFEIVNNTKRALDINELIDKKVKEFIRPFDLYKAPLFRAGIYEIEKDRFILMYDMHHIISDGVSVSIISKELVDLYRGDELENLKIQYKDFCVWQSDELKSEHAKKYEKYWLDRFDGLITQLDLPTDFPRPSVKGFGGESYEINIEAKMANKLKSLTRETESTLYMMLLAGFNVLLSKYCGQEDIIIGTPITGRYHRDLENIVGMFVNTLPMRNNPIGDKSFHSFLCEVRENSLKAYENQAYQLDDLVNRLGIKRRVDRNPLFDVVFVLQNFEMNSANIDGLEFSSCLFETKVSKFDITLEAVEIEECINLKFEYSTELFKSDTIEKMARDYINILEQVLENRTIEIKNIKLENKFHKLTNVINEEFEFNF